MQKPKLPTSDDFMKLLDSLFQQAKDGTGNLSKSVPEICDEYLAKYGDPETALRKFNKAQIAKCTTSGFITGLGGLITLPVAIPANLSSVLYVQLRMIAGAAYIGGYDLDDDEVRTFIYACLAGVSLGEIFKKFGNEVGQKLATEAIKKIPVETIRAINKKLGWLFMTKFGETGTINLGKMVPVVGGVINSGFDFAQTKAISRQAYKNFILNDFSVGTQIDFD